MSPNQEGLQSIHGLLIQAIGELRELQNSLANADAVFEIEMGLEWTLSRIRVLMDRAARPHS